MNTPAFLEKKAIPWVVNIPVNMDWFESLVNFLDLGKQKININVLHTDLLHKYWNTIAQGWTLDFRDMLRTVWIEGYSMVDTHSLSNLRTYLESCRSTEYYAIRNSDGSMNFREKKSWESILADKIVIFHKKHRVKKVVESTLAKTKKALANIF